MDYRLAEQLKDAGFGNKQQWAEGHVPTLSELIEVCAEKFSYLSQKFDQDGKPVEWVSGERDAFDVQYIGKTPEEAVSALWLALNSK